MSLIGAGNVYRSDQAVQNLRRGLINSEATKHIECVNAFKMELLNFERRESACIHRPIYVIM